MEILDSRDLRAEMAELLEAAAEQELDSEDASRLAHLTELDAEFPEYDFYMIAEYDFPEYAEQFAYDIGAVSEDHSWPNCHIDWEAAANSLAMDYSHVEFDGTTYLMREL